MHKSAKYISFLDLFTVINEDALPAEIAKPDFIKYPPVNLALQFAQETLLDKNIKPLGFHNFKTPGCEGGIYWYNQYLNEI